MSTNDGIQATPNVALGNLQGIYNGLAPRSEKPKGLPMKLDFRDLDEAKGTLLFGEFAGLLEFCQSVFVDNSDNLNELIIRINEPNQRLVIPAQSQGEFPVYASNPLSFRITTPHAADLFVPLMWKNVPGAFTPWGPISIGNVNATLLPTIASAINWSDDATGASQIIIPANANRKRFTVQNPPASTDYLYLAFGVAATTNNGIALQPGASYDSNFGPLDVSDIVVINPTAANRIIAWEWD